MSALEQLLKEGKILAAGVSNFNVQEIEQSNKIITIASNQPPYSMVIRDIEKDVLPYCRQHQIGIIVYSPLQRGLLTGKFKPDHKFASGDHRAGLAEFQPDYIRRVDVFLDKLKPIATKYNATLGQLVLNWTIQQPGVTVALAGARDAQQAEENAKAASLNVSQEDISQINQFLQSLQPAKAGA
jgi:aryl-alcohol dehydrogenase-like predicted oxidoreductase